MSSPELKPKTDYSAETDSPRYGFLMPGYKIPEELLSCDPPVYITNQTEPETAKPDLFGQPNPEPSPGQPKEQFVLPDGFKVFSTDLSLQKIKPIDPSSISFNKYAQRELAKFTKNPDFDKHPNQTSLLEVIVDGEKFYVEVCKRGSWLDQQYEIKQAEEKALHPTEK